MRILFLCSLLLLPVFALSGLSQSNNVNFAPPKRASLPLFFFRFSAHDVLKQIFESYDPATGRVRNILNSNQQPTLVRINEAKSWKADEAEHLVVLAELAADDYQFAEDGLCGNCAAYVILAVLKKEGDRLSLIAKQTPPPSSVVGDSVTPSNPFKPSMIGGHNSLSLDLASYKLNGQETLIGVRDELSVMGSESVSLNLYRIEGQRLREVFRNFLLDLRYTGDRTIRMTISTLSPLPGDSRFYDYGIN